MPRRETSCINKIGTTAATVPHIAHFNRCLTTGWWLLKNRQTRINAPADTPITKCQKTVRYVMPIRLYRSSRCAIVSAIDVRKKSCGISEMLTCQIDIKTTGAQKRGNLYKL